MSETKPKSQLLDQRDDKGRILPGSTLTGAGRPKGIERMLRERFRDDWGPMADVIRDIALGKIPPNTKYGVTNIKPRDSIEAYKVLTDRAYGKAKVTIDLAADIGANGLAGVPVEDLDDHALQMLRDTIQRTLDPRQRVIDAKSVYKDANVQPLGAALPGGEQPQVDTSKLVEIPNEDTTAPFETNTDSSPLSESSVFVAPARELVRHVFKGSHNVAAAVLDVATGIVEVTFTSGARYRFANFTRELLAQWGLAVSAGKWFNANIKMRPAVHPAVKIV